MGQVRGVGGRGGGGLTRKNVGLRRGSTPTLEAGPSPFLVAPHFAPPPHFPNLKPRPPRGGSRPGGVPRALRWRSGCGDHAKRLPFLFLSLPPPPFLLFPLGG